MITTHTSSWWHLQSIYTCFTQRHVCTCTNKLINPKEVLPAKAFSFADLLEIHERTMLVNKWIVNWGSQQCRRSYLSVRADMVEEHRADFKPEENRSSLVYVCTHICPVYLLLDCHDCFFFSSTSGHRQGFVQLVHKGAEGTSITLFNISIYISSRVNSTHVDLQVMCVLAIATCSSDGWIATATSSSFIFRGSSSSFCFCGFFIFIFCMWERERKREAQSHETNVLLSLVISLVISQRLGSAFPGC